MSWSGGEALFPVKTTCCLYYKTAGSSPEERAAALCSGCPLRDDETRRDRLVQFLESSAAPASLDLVR